MTRTVVGAREFKTRLGTYIRRVRRGEVVVVTERGEPVAELAPLGIAAGGEQARLARLVGLGVLARRRSRRLRPFRPIRGAGLALADAIVDGRAERL